DGIRGRDVTGVQTCALPIWLRRGRMPHLLALTVASWFAAVVPPTGYDPGPVAAAMTDPDQAMLRGIAEGARSPAEHARRLLASGCLSEEIAEQDAFIDRVGERLGIIVASGPLAAGQEAIEASETPGASRWPLERPARGPRPGRGDPPITS